MRRELGGGGRQEALGFAGRLGIVVAALVVGSRFGCNRRRRKVRRRCCRCGRQATVSHISLFELLYSKNGMVLGRCKGVVVCLSYLK